MNILQTEINAHQDSRQLKYNTAQLHVIKCTQLRSAVSKKKLV